MQECLFVVTFRGDLILCFVYYEMAPLTFRYRHLRRASASVTWCRLEGTREGKRVKAILALR